MNAKIKIIEAVCSALLIGDKEKAKQIAIHDYPFAPQISSKRKITEVERVKIYIRDGFIDRYSGESLIYPGTIVLLSELLPEEFPYHTNWKMNACHPCYWEFWPTIDHVIPIARGGSDTKDNWVCTSMARNSAKANFLLNEIDWQLCPRGNFREWDGLIHWFVEYVESNSNLLEVPRIKKWHSCARACLKSL